MTEILLGKGVKKMKQTNKTRLDYKEYGELLYSIWRYHDNLVKFLFGGWYLQNY
jgi:hypothetical protein